MPKKKTHEEFQEDLIRLFGNDYILTSEYKGSKVPVTVKHLLCGHEWTAKPINIIHTQGCPKCTQKRMAQKRVIPKEQFLKELQDKHPTIEMIGEYIDYTTPVKFRCLIDGNEWEDRPIQMLHLKHSCAVCCGKKIIPGYNSFNDIKPQFAKYLVNYEDGYKFTPSTKMKLKFKCPDCGSVVEKSLISLKDRFSCPYCGDGISYPEKYFYSFLKQFYSNEEIVRQKQFKISNKSFYYDFYIPIYEIIFEINGAQHYTSDFFKTVAENVKNDKIKYDLAIKNGILPNNYIVIDARESQPDFIKASITNHHFFKDKDLSFINWDECASYAMSSLMIKANIMYNSGKTISEIASEINVCTVTVNNYLKKGTQFNSCKKSQVANSDLF